MGCRNSREPHPLARHALIAAGQPGFVLVTGGLAANGYRAHLARNYPMASAFVIEALLTAGFRLVIIGATDARSGWR